MADQNIGATAPPSADVPEDKKPVEAKAPKRRATVVVDPEPQSIPEPVQGHKTDGEDDVDSDDGHEGLENGDANDEDEEEETGDLLEDLPDDTDVRSFPSQI